MVANDDFFLTVASLDFDMCMVPTWDTFNLQKLSNIE